MATSTSMVPGSSPHFGFVGVSEIKQLILTCTQIVLKEVDLSLEMTEVQQIIPRKGSTPIPPMSQLQVI